MGPFSKRSEDQKPVTTDASPASVSNDTSPAPVTSSATSTPVVKKEKHSKAFSFVSVLFLLMLLTAGVMTYLWYDQKSANDGLQAEVTSAESTVAALRTKLSSETTDNPDQAVSNEPAKVSDEDQIKTLAEARYYAETANKNPDPNLKVTINKLELPFARVGVTGGANGVSCIYKKVSETWVHLYCTQAQNAETQDMDKRYGVPESIIRS